MRLSPPRPQLSNFLGTPGERLFYFGNPKSLNFDFLVIWWGKEKKGVFRGEIPNLSMSFRMI